MSRIISPGKMMAITDRIRELMDRRGLTIEGLAIALGEKPQRVKDVLRGKQRVPEEMLVALARMHEDVVYLLTGLPAAAHAKLAVIGQASGLMQRAGVPKEIGALLMPELIKLLEQVPALMPDETELLTAYRNCSADDKAAVRGMANRFAQLSPAVQPASTKVPKRTRSEGSK